MGAKNNWENVFKTANEELKQFNISLAVTKEDDNSYGLDIVYPDKIVCYACGYFESELEELIEETYLELKLSHQTV